MYRLLICALVWHVVCVVSACVCVCVCVFKCMDGCVMAEFHIGIIFACGWTKIYS